MLGRTARTRRLAAVGVGIGLLLSVTTSTAAVDPSPSADPSASPPATAEASPSPSPSPDPSASPDPSIEPSPAISPPPEPSPSPSPPPLLTVALAQAATSYDVATNVATVAVTARPGGQAAPWRYSFAVRGTVVASGSSTDPSVRVALRNACSITTQSVTVSVTDALGRTASVAGTLDRSLCPPPPAYPHAADRILAGPTLTEASFVDRLRAVGSPTLAQASAIYRTLVAAGVNPAFALGTFHAESHSGTRGYAVVTRNWGNILYYAWEVPYGAVPYAPGNGYTYAMYPDWLSSVRAYADLLRRYHLSGYTTVSSASAHWLGTIEGSSRHRTYLNNITAVMSILPDDAVPVVTALTVPASSGATVGVSWSASDNLAVTGYELRTRLGSGAWSPAESIGAAGAPTASMSRPLTLSTGAWTIGIRATDAAGNWSPWRTAIVTVDAVAPTVTGLAASSTIVRTVDGSFSVRWSASDDRGVAGYQWRSRRSPDGPWSSTRSTTAGSVTLKPGPGTWSVGVRARDAVGNWSDWREVRAVVPVDDRRYTFSAGTTRRTSTVDYRGTLTTSSRAGARLTTTFTGTAFYLIGDSGPSLGRMRVTIDGASFIVDAGTYKGARATTTRHRLILFSRAVAAGTHSVTITNLATRGRPTIAIDGLAFVQ